MGLGELPSHELHHLRDDEQANRLAQADAAHPERSLRVVSEGHVLAEGEHGDRVRHVADVGAGRVHLVVEAEAAVERDERVGELDRALRLLPTMIDCRADLGSCPRR